jgi:hypothetical protein
MCIVIMTGCGGPFDNLGPEETIRAYRCGYSSANYQILPGFWGGRMKRMMSKCAEDAQQVDRHIVWLRMYSCAKYGAQWEGRWPTAWELHKDLIAPEILSPEHWEQEAPGVFVSNGIMLKKCDTVWRFEASQSLQEAYFPPMSIIFGTLPEFVAQTTREYVNEIVQDIRSGRISTELDLLRRLVTLKTSQPPKGIASDDDVRQYLEGE